MKKIFSLFVCFFFLSSMAWGATYYARYDTGTLYYKSGAWPTTGDNDGNSTDLDDLFDDLDNAGHTVVLASDTYSGTELDAADGIDTVDGNITIRAPISSDPEYSTYGGTVTIDGSGVADTTFRIIDDTVTLEDISFIGKSDEICLQVARDTDVLNDLIISGANIGISSYNCGSTFNRIKITSSTTDSMLITGTVLTDNPTFNYCWFDGGNNGVRITHGGTVTINNCLITGAATEGLIVSTNAVTVNVNNSILVGNVTSRGNNHTINNTGGGTVTATNCLLLPHPTNGDTYNWNNLTDGGNNVYSEPMFMGAKKQGRVAFIIDDYANLSHAGDVAAIANSYGYPVVLGLSTEPTNGVGGVQTISSANWDTMATFVDNGNEVAAHGARHTDLSLLDAGFVAYTGDASTATMTISVSGNSITTTLAGDQTDGSSNLSIDISNASYDTMYEVIAYIEAQTGYSATVESATDSADTLTLDDITGQDIKTDGNGADPENHTMLFDQALYFTNEISDPKTTIETELGSRVAAGSYSCDSFVFPLNAQNEAAQDSIKSAGYLGARCGPTCDREIEDLQIFQVYGPNADLILGNDNEARNAAGLLQVWNHLGYVCLFYAHGADEFSLSDWTNLIKECHKSNIVVSDLRDFFTYIRTGTDADADQERWTRTITDNTNYKLKVGSPAKDTGLNSVWSGTVNITDFGGNDITNSVGTIIADFGIVDMGIYECQLGHGKKRSGMGMGM